MVRVRVRVRVRARVRVEVRVRVRVGLGLGSGFRLGDRCSYLASGRRSGGRSRETPGPRT